jgi:hypothetical protein
VVRVILRTGTCPTSESGQRGLKWSAALRALAVEAKSYARAPIEHTIAAVDPEAVQALVDPGARSAAAMMRWRSMVVAVLLRTRAPHPLADGLADRFDEP